MALSGEAGERKTQVRDMAGGTKIAKPFCLQQSS